MRRDTRRLLLVLATGVLLSGGGAAVVEWRDRDGRPVEDNPVALVSAVPSTTVPVPVEQSTTTTALTTPVLPPADPYEEEPIVEIGTIDIPKIGLTHPIFHGISMLNIDKGPSHWPGSALPGETGNAVFAGHRVTHSHPFRHIDKLVVGDEVTFTVHGVRTLYKVTETFVVAPSRLDIVAPTPMATATLFACHPPGSARERYVVRLALAS